MRMQLCQVGDHGNELILFCTSRDLFGIALSESEHPVNRHREAYVCAFNVHDRSPIRLNARH
jgi:hypothetical protein